MRGEEEGKGCCYEQILCYKEVMGCPAPTSAPFVPRSSQPVYPNNKRSWEGGLHLALAGTGVTVPMSLLCRKMGTIPAEIGTRCFASLGDTSASSHLLEDLPRSSRTDFEP